MYRAPNSIWTTTATKNEKQQRKLKINNNKTNEMARNKVIHRAYYCMRTKKIEFKLNAEFHLAICFLLAINEPTILFVHCTHTSGMCFLAPSNLFIFMKYTQICSNKTNKKKRASKCHAL